MIKFLTKESFQQRIADIVALLVIVQLVCAVTSILIKLIQPCLKKISSLYSRKQTNSTEHMSEIDTSEAKCNLKKRDNKLDEMLNICNSDEGFCTTIESFKSIMGEPDFPVKKLSTVSHTKKVHFTDELFKFDETVEPYPNADKKKNSIETQTYITINPKLYLDSNPFEKKSSMCSHVSSNSYKAVGNRRKHSEEINKLVYFDPLNLIEEHNISNESKQINNMLDGAVLTNNNLMESDNLIPVNFGRDISEESKILGTAIKDFQNELKPIKDQIQMLKKSLNVIQNTFSNHILPCDGFSSESETILVSDNLSGTLSTTCTSSLYTSLSSHHTLLANQNLVQMRRRKSLYTIESNGKTVSNMSMPIAKEFIDHVKNVDLEVQTCKASKKLSPFSEMYVQLAHLSTRKSSYQLKGKYNVIPCYVTGSRVTCHINVNVIPSVVSVNSGHKTSLPKEPTIHPIISDPEDILVQSVYNKCNSS